MKSKNANIFVSSVSKISERLKFYGDASLENISLLRLIYKYACYSTSQTQLQSLDKMVAKLQREDEFICLERQSSGVVSYTSPVGVITIGETNSKPSLSAASITVGEETEVYLFSYTDLFSSYSDDGGGTPSSFVVSQLPLEGILLYDGVAVVVNELLYDATKLTYQRNGGDAYSASFNYYAYDDNSQLPLASDSNGCAITVEALLVENLPPTVGDTKLYSNNRVDTVFTSANFTTDAVGPYADTEGDQFGAIKILEISQINSGVYYYLGSPVAVGQIITKDEIDQGAFYHRGADSNSIETDTISVAVRAATGDQSWIE